MLPPVKITTQLTYHATQAPLLLPTQRWHRKHTTVQRRQKRQKYARCQFEREITPMVIQSYCNGLF